MRLIDKVNYNGQEVDFYELERLVLAEYGDWNNVPERSEAERARQKYGWVKGEKTEKALYPEVVERIEDFYEEKDPLKTVRYQYTLNKEVLQNEIKKNGYNQSLLSMSMGFRRGEIGGSFTRSAKEELVEKLLIALPNLKYDDLVVGKRIREYQPRFKAKPEIFDHIKDEDVNLIFESRAIFADCKQKRQLNVLHLNKINELYGLKHEEMVINETES